MTLKPETDSLAQDVTFPKRVSSHTPKVTLNTGVKKTPGERVKHKRYSRVGSLGWLVLRLGDD
jgi:hypothetical protein